MLDCILAGSLVGENRYQEIDFDLVEMFFIIS